MQDLKLMRGDYAHLLEEAKNLRMAVEFADHTYMGGCFFAYYGFLLKREDRVLSVYAIRYWADDDWKATVRYDENVSFSGSGKSVQHALVDSLLNVIKFSEARERADGA